MNVPMMQTSFFSPTHRRAALLLLLLLTGCGGLLPKATAPPSIYSLDDTPRAAPAVPMATVGRGPTLIVGPVRAAPGIDSLNIFYVRSAHRIDHYAHSEWSAPPARMLHPLVVAEMDATGDFEAVRTDGSGTIGDLRLDIELLRLQQEFGQIPSRVRLSLRATLSDAATGKVLSWQAFDELALSDSEDAYGGVVAANRAVQAAMRRLAVYCGEVAVQWRAAHPA